LSAAILDECSFDLGYCGWTSVGEKDKWKLPPNNAFIKYPGSFKRNRIYKCIAALVFV